MSAPLYRGVNTPGRGWGVGLALLSATHRQVTEAGMCEGGWGRDSEPGAGPRGRSCALRSCVPGHPGPDSGSPVTCRQGDGVSRHRSAHAGSASGLGLTAGRQPGAHASAALRVLGFPGPRILFPWLHRRPSWMWKLPGLSGIRRTDQHVGSSLSNL